MKTTLSQIATLGSLCVLLAGTATAAFAQGDDHGDHHGDQGGYSQHQSGQGDRQYGDQGGDYRRSDQYRHANQNERRRLDRLHAAYARAAFHGNYGAAERAHEHAQAIRAQMHDQHGDQRHDDQYHNDHQGDHQDHHDNN